VTGSPRSGPGVTGIPMLLWARIMIISGGIKRGRKTWSDGGGGRNAGHGRPPATLGSSSLHRHRHRGRGSSDRAPIQAT
jgi:hypothetical protein